MATKKPAAPKSTVPNATVVAKANPAEMLTLIANTPLRLNGVDIGEGDTFTATAEDGEPLLTADLAVLASDE